MRINTKRSMQLHNKAAGLTVVELLLVVGLVAILAASSTPFLIRFLQTNHQDTTVDKVIGTIRKAQSYSISSKLDDTWGACIYNDNIRLYNETCSSSSVTEDYPIPGTVTITGFSDTTFSKGRGEPSNTLTITVETDIDSAEITLNAAGGMEIN